MNNTLRTFMAVGPVALLATACSGAPATTETPAEAPSAAEPSEPRMSTVLFIGDSVAVGQSLPLAAAFEQTGVEFRSLASEGGGNVVGPFSEEHWETLPEEISSASPDVVVHQLTTYDWGTREEQLDGYEQLLSTVTENEAELVLVTMPPIEPDDFYAPHMDDLERTPQIAREIAEGSDGEATVLDATEVWGEEYAQDRDGMPDRNPDGVHTCPQGAARFTHWLLDELAELYPDFTPPEAEAWADDDWTADEHFAAC